MEDERDRKQWLERHPVVAALYVRAADIFKSFEGRTKQGSLFHLHLNTWETHSHTRSNNLLSSQLWQLGVLLHTRLQAQSHTHTHTHTHTHLQAQSQTLTHAMAHSTTLQSRAAELALFLSVWWRQELGKGWARKVETVVFYQNLVESCFWVNCDLFRFQELFHLVSVNQSSSSAARRY